MFKSTRSHDATLVVSVGAFGVSLAIVSRTNPPAIALATSGQLSLDERSIAQTTSAIKQLIIEKGTPLIKTYSQNGGRAISTVFLMLQAPLTESFSVKAAKTFAEPIKVTDALLDSLARTALGEQDKKEKFMSATMLQVSLNGYRTAKPEGKHAASVELTGLIGIADPALKETLVGAVLTLLPHVEITLRPGSLALIESARRISGAWAENSLIVYLTGDGTELIALHDGLPSACFYIPVGIRYIANLAFPGRPAEAALAELRLSAKGYLSDESMTQNESSLLRVESDLARAYGESLSKRSSEQRLPPAIVLLAPRELSSWFTHFLERIDFAPFTMTSQPFTVSEISPTSFGLSQNANIEDAQLELAVSLLRAGI